MHPGIAQMGIAFGGRDAFVTQERLQPPQGKAAQRAPRSECVPQGMHRQVVGRLSIKAGAVDQGIKRTGNVAPLTHRVRLIPKATAAVAMTRSAVDQICGRVEVRRARICSRLTGQQWLSGK